MEITQPPVNPPLAPTPKKGLGTGAKVGIGCGGLALLVIIGIVIAGIMGAGKLKKFAEDAQKDPTRTTATMMVSASMGNMEMVAEDEVNKRYTVKDKKSGTMTTIYWDANKNAPAVIQGDFSAIPAETAITSPSSGNEAVPDTEKK